MSDFIGTLFHQVANCNATAVEAAQAALAASYAEGRKLRGIGSYTGRHELLQ